MKTITVTFQCDNDDAERALQEILSLLELHGCKSDYLILEEAA